MEETHTHSVKGYQLCLRIVTPEDAAYIHALRTDAQYNEHLSSIDGTPQDQYQWIKKYKRREERGVEYYYIIERLDGIPCGTVRIYNIRDDKFTWGSWILDKNKPNKAALESALLVYKISFEMLNLTKAIFDVRKENTHTLAFHYRFGATETGRDHKNIYFEYTQEKYFSDVNKYTYILREEAAIAKKHDKEKYDARRNS